ncbi:MAG: hypothetical protein JNK11_01895, partial [Alphaproteobacteria bacterium]|nr:hypothetical protein [Alphaproteobacteria bacterium]
MSILDSRSLRCPRCGTELQATLLDTADASRLPALRDAVLDGTLDRADCRACGAALRIDRRLLYLDRDRGTALLALPERSRAKPEREVQHVADVLALLPSAHADPALAMPHVVRGSGGLREALVAADAALPPERLDALKALLRAAHPTLARRPSLQLLLESADAGDLRFAAVDRRGRARYRVDLPGAAAPDALDEIDAIVAAAVAARTPTSWTARLAAACRRAWPWPVEPATP